MNEGTVFNKELCFRVWVIVVGLSDVLMVGWGWARRPSWEGVGTRSMDEGVSPSLIIILIKLNKAYGGIVYFAFLQQNKLQQQFNVFTIFCNFSAANLLGNFSVALTYDLFITLGLITAVPVSAGKNPPILYKSGICQYNVYM